MERFEDGLLVADMLKCLREMNEKLNSFAISQAVLQGEVKSLSNKLDDQFLDFKARLSSLEKSHLYLDRQLNSTIAKVQKLEEVEGAEKGVKKSFLVGLNAVILIVIALVSLILGIK